MTLCEFMGEAIVMVCGTPKAENKKTHHDCKIIVVYAIVVDGRLEEMGIFF